MPASWRAHCWLLVFGGRGVAKQVSVPTRSLSAYNVMLCVKTDSPGVLRAGAGDVFVGFYAQHTLYEEGNSKAALSLSISTATLFLESAGRSFMPIISTEQVSICARQFRVKSGSKDLPVGQFRVRPQNSGAPRCFA